METTQQYFADKGFPVLEQVMSMRNVNTCYLVRFQLKHVGVQLAQVSQQRLLFNASQRMPTIVVKYPNFSLHMTTGGLRSGRYS